MRALVLAFLLLLTFSAMFGQVQAKLLVGKNVDVAGETGADRQRVEPTIAVDPRNPSIIVAGAQDLRLIHQGGHRWHGYYRSTDNGKTWTSTLLPGFPGDTSTQGLASPLHGFEATSDPVLVFDLKGNLYYAGITVCCPGFVPFVAKFVNDGADYNGTFIVTSISFADKPWISVDTTGGPGSGNVYFAADGEGRNFSQVGLVFSRSTDGGITWSGAVVLSKASQLPGVAVDGTGSVYVSSVLPGISKTNPSLADVLVTKSADGGLTFGSPVTAAIATLLPSPLPGNKFRSFLIPQIAADGRGVYLVWDDFGTGSSDVLFTRSTDGGTTWSSPITVNDVTTGQHFFPSVAVSSGIISIIWYDSRLGQLSNGTITGLDVFYSQSTNVGASFSSNLRVTSTSFNPNLVERSDFNDTEIFMGDYIQVAASAAAAHPIWADNSNACDTIDPTFGCVDQDAFTTTITF